MTTVEDTVNAVERVRLGRARIAEGGEAPNTDREVCDAVTALTGDELVSWLAGYDYAKPERAPARVTPADPKKYAAHYNDVAEPGVGGAAPNTWDEVEYLHNAGMIDHDTFHAAYKAWMAQ